jgi:hypothetical protein
VGGDEEKTGRRGRPAYMENTLSPIRRKEFWKMKIKISESF